MAIHVLCTILISFFCYWVMSPLCILDINPLLDISCEYLLPFSRLSFHFVDGFLHCKEAFQFDVVLFVYFCFGFPCSRTHIQKAITKTDVNDLLPMFSSMIFMNSCLTFQSLIHFEFSLVYGVRELYSFFLCFFFFCMYLHCFIFNSFLFVYWDSLCFPLILYMIPFNYLNTFTIAGLKSVFDKPNIWPKERQFWWLLPPIPHRVGFPLHVSELNLFLN